MAKTCFDFIPSFDVQNRLIIRVRVELNFTSPKKVMNDFITHIVGFLGLRSALLLRIQIKGSASLISTNLVGREVVFQAADEMHHQSSWLTP